MANVFIRHIGRKSGCQFVRYPQNERARRRQEKCRCVVVCIYCVILYKQESLAWREGKRATDPSRGTPSNINVIYTSYFQCATILSLTMQSSQKCEVAQNSEKIWTYNSSRSHKVIDLGANGKRICNFPSVISSNFGRISYRFRDIDA